MSPLHFSVHEHTVPCSHIRGFERATADANDEQLQLAVKQYIPLDNTDPQPGDITIIGAHANGIPKVYSRYESSNKIPRHVGARGRLTDCTSFTGVI